MKTIPKRSDLYTNPTEKNSNLKEQMSQLLEIKNLLNQKLTCLTGIINDQVLSFVSRNQPNKFQDINLIRIQKNLFGTKRTFRQFQKDYKDISSSLQSDIKGVVEILEKFTFTKVISIFITSGVLDNFLKMHDLMLKREQFCNNLLLDIQKDVLKGNGSIFTKSYSQTSFCVKCCSLIQKQRVNQTKKAVLLAGLRTKQFHERQLEERYSSEQEQNQSIQNYYGKARKIKRKADFSHINDPEMISQQAMKFNLNRLQSNIQQRKHEILTCLIQMGQFGSQLKTSEQNLQKMIHVKEQKPQEIYENTTQTLAKRLELSPQNSILSKFNFKQFTFDISKYFYKEIKDIQNELHAVKNKFSSLLQSSSEKQTQCDLSRDFYEKQTQKNKKKSQRQQTVLKNTIQEISEKNKNLKSKVDQYQNAVKIYICSKLDEQKEQIQKITVQMRISRLIQKYQKKLSQQQKQLKILKQANSNKNKKQTSQTQQIIQKSNQIQGPTTTYNKQNINRVNNQRYEGIKSKRYLHVQDIVRKRRDKTDNYKKKQKQKQEQNNEKSYFSKKKNNQNSNYQTEIVEQTLQNDKQKETQVYQQSYNSQLASINADLQIISNVIQISIEPSKQNTNIRLRQHKVSKSKSRQKIQQYLVGNTQAQKKIKIFIDKIKKDKQDLISSNGNYKRKQKIIKVKSQAENLGYRGVDDINQQKSFKNKNKKNQKNNQNIGINDSQNLLGSLKELTVSLKKNGKQVKKTAKALSVAFDKKNSQQENQLNAQGKLPSLSQYQNQINKTGKLKHLQKAINNKNAQLTKKKRMKRNFSQQTLALGQFFDKSQQQLNLGNKLQKDSIFRQKSKKQYIIDFIPKVKEQNDLQQQKEQYQNIGQTQIQKIFNFQKYNDNITNNQRREKTKYLTKVINLKNTGDDKSFMTLKKEQIGLSTKIYSIFASIKFLNSKLYQIIINKIRQGYDKKDDIKNNCDQISMSMKINQCNNNISPLSMPIKTSQLQGYESSFQSDIKINFHLSAKTNKLEQSKPSVLINGQKEQKKQRKMLKQVFEGQKQVMDQTQLRKIINYLIIKHRNSCYEVKNVKNKEQGQFTTYTCRHVEEFYKFLVQTNSLARGNIPHN